MPRNKTGIIIRKPLLDRLTALAKEQIVFLKAPGGYGKSVITRQWLESYENSAFVQLDDGDNNLDKLCRKLALAVQKMDMSNDELNNLIVSSTFAIAPEEYLLRITDVLSPTSCGAIVIDDLYLLHNHDSISIIDEICSAMPPNVALAICSRETPPAELEHLILNGDLVIIDSSFLVFTPSEVKELYSSYGVDVSVKKSKEIAEKSGGWAIGLRALLMSDEDENFIKLPILDNFLRNHVWNFWSEEQQQFMLQTCAAYRFTPEMCKALTGRGDSEAFLDELSRSNSFMNQIKDGEYQYHHLFKDFLFHMASENDVFLKNQYVLLGEYYMGLEEMDIYNAIVAFHKSGNEDYIVETLLLAYTHMNRDLLRIDTLIQIIELTVSDELVAKYPFLYFYKSWAALCLGNPDNAEKYMDLYFENYDIIVATMPELSYTIVRMFIMDYRTPLRSKIPQFIKYAPKKSPATSGSFTMDMPLFHRGYRDFSELVHGGIVKNLEILRHVMRKQIGKETDTLVNIMIAGLLYEQGLYEKSLKYALIVFGRFDTDMVQSTRFCALSIAFHVLEAMGDTERANEFLHNMEHMIENDRAYHLLPSFQALKFSRKLYSGNIKSAKDWLKHHILFPEQPLNFYKLSIYFTSARAHLLLEEYANAAILLERILTLVTRFNRTLDIIECKILLSILFWQTTSQQDTALTYLEEALELASEYDFSQLFMNDCADIIGMLQRVINRMEQKEKSSKKLKFSRKLLSQMKISGNMQRSIVPKLSGQKVSLTKRQAQILKLLSEGNNFAEVAENLDISRTTVRSHMELIYKKLHVTSLEDAIKKYAAM